MSVDPFGMKPTVSVEQGCEILKDLKTTNGAGKMELIRSANTSPVDNDFCLKMSESKAICSSCYSMRSLKSYRKTCRPSWYRNGVLLTMHEYPVEAMPVVMDRVFRIHSHGEIISPRHYRNIIRLACRNPETIFAFWSKRKDIVQRAGVENIPSNVIMIYSNPSVDRVSRIIPKGFSKVFNVVSKEHAKRNKIAVNCGARKCFECQRCYKFETESVIVELKKK